MKASFVVVLSIVAAAACGGEADQNTEAELETAPVAAPAPVVVDTMGVASPHDTMSGMGGDTAATP